MDVERCPDATAQDEVGSHTSENRSSEKPQDDEDMGCSLGEAAAAGADKAAPDGAADDLEETDATVPMEGTGSQPRPESSYQLMVEMLSWPAKLASEPAQDTGTEEVAVDSQVKAEAAEETKADAAETKAAVEASAKEEAGEVKTEAPAETKRETSKRTDVAAQMDPQQPVEESKRRKRDPVKYDNRPSQCRFFFTHPFSGEAVQVTVLASNNQTDKAERIARLLYGLASRGLDRVYILELRSRLYEVCRSGAELPADTPASLESLHNECLKPSPETKLAEEVRPSKRAKKAKAEDERIDRKDERREEKQEERRDPLPKFYLSDSTERGVIEGPMPEELRKVLPEEPPPGSDACTKVKYERAHNRVVFTWVTADDRKQQFQTTLLKCQNYLEAAFAIGRSCYYQFLMGLSKDEVQVYRDGCYRALAEATKNWTPSGAPSASESKGPSARTSAKEKEPGRSGGRKKASKSNRSSSGSGEDSSSSSGSRSSAHRPTSASQPPPSRKEFFMPPAVLKQDRRRPPTVVRVAAKMAVRTGLRCYCCFASECKTGLGGTRRQTSPADVRGLPAPAAATAKVQ